jgi:hypothetical protein
VGWRYRVISLPFDHTEQPSAVHFWPTSDLPSNGQLVGDAGQVVRRNLPASRQGLPQGLSRAACTMVGLLGRPNYALRARPNYGSTHMLRPPFGRRPFCRLMPRDKAAFIARCGYLHQSRTNLCR